MKTRVPGLIELSCGWFVGVGAVPGGGLVKVTLHFDPEHEASFSGRGVTVLNISASEAAELEEALRAARRGS